MYRPFILRSFPVFSGKSAEILKGWEMYIPHPFKISDFHSVIFGSTVFGVEYSDKLYTITPRRRPTVQKISRPLSKSSR